VRPLAGTVKSWRLIRQMPRAGATSIVGWTSARLATLHAPPPVLLTWASLSFACVLQKASQKFIMFKPDGTPVRARLQVTFSEFRNVDSEAKEVKRQTADYSKLHTVTDGDSLPLIAWREYGQPTAWRPIALRNGIDDPRRLQTGDVLVLPRLPYRDRDTGALHDAGPNT